MHSQHPHLYAAGSQSAAAAAYQNAAAAAGYNMTQPPQYNVIMMPVNHPAGHTPAGHGPQPAYTPTAYPGGPPGRDAAMMYGAAQPAGMMLAAQPMSQRSATVPQVHLSVCLSVCLSCVF